MTTKVIGQDNLVKQLSNIIEAYKNSEGAIKPHFIITGPSGNGKTETIQYLCEKYELQMVELNAAGLTKEGLSGNSVTKALAPLKNYTNRLVVAFIDEWDKLFLTSDGTTCDVHEATRGVQNEFLKALEGKNLQVFGDYGKYDTINISKVLFVFAGAFNNETGINVNRLSELGVKREFLGRVPLVFEVKKLTADQLIEIAERSTLLHQWLTLSFTLDQIPDQKKKVLTEIKKYILAKNDDNIIGARWISALIHRYFLNNGVLDDTPEEKMMPNKPLMQLFDENSDNSNTSHTLDDDDDF